jgi:site-specific DNA-cytosine methylase
MHSPLAWNAATMLASSHASTYSATAAARFALIFAGGWIKRQTSDRLNAIAESSNTDDDAYLRALFSTVGYKFTGNKTETVKQIGNAVPPQLADALLSAHLNAA